MHFAKMGFRKNYSWAGSQEFSNLSLMRSRIEGTSEQDIAKVLGIPLKRPYEYRVCNRE